MLIILTKICSEKEEGEHDDDGEDQYSDGVERNTD
jgi:hypothetical protein